MAGSRTSIGLERKQKHLNTWASGSTGGARSGWYTNMWRVNSELEVSFNNYYNEYDWVCINIQVVYWLRFLSLTPINSSHFRDLLRFTTCD
ncbi:hypothetical protein KGM_200009 [Danaus plexippus plexippus]|uniref:Uncharacterized protein n=1 Tax=Danaus plexippus plexippus TaxID=278856 RepID=A0A212EK48_DANPL|nr:hypothetical protein KGM_200009 [Danaus plexippus plexippus]